MGCCDAGAMSVQDALTTMLAQIAPVNEIMTVPLATAQGHILAENVLSPLNMPPFDNSAMDGYAFDGAQLKQDAPLRLNIIGTALAGKAWQGQVGAGECVKIMTGASMPPNCDTVIPQELCEYIGESHIQITGNR